jgi:putative heme iron utilization protein
MADLLTPAVSDRICKHMNDDHAEAVALYARVYGHIEPVLAAEMLSIDADGMNLSTRTDEAGDPIQVRIPFDHPLQDSEDAHHTLIAMIKQARH